MKRTLWTIGAIFMTITLLCTIVTFLLSEIIFDRFRRDAVRTFAEDAREELEGELALVHEDLLFWRERYRERIAAGVSGGIAPPFKPTDSHRGTRYDLLMLIDSCGKVRAFRAAGPDEATKGILGDDYTKYAAPAAGGADWLRPIFEAPSPLEEEDKKKKEEESAALGWQEFPNINALLGRSATSNAPPSDPNGKEPRDRQIEMHQFALAIPIVIEQSGCQGQVGALAVVVRWSHFQEILDRVEERLKSYSFNSGYAYLIDVDSSTVIGHQKAEVYGTRLETLFAANPGLAKFQQAIRKQKDDFVSYEYPGDTKKTAYLTRVRQMGDRPIPPQLAWNLGVGVNEQDVSQRARAESVKFLLPNLFISLMGVAAYWWYIRRFQVSFSDLIGLVRQAPSIDEIDPRKADRGEQRYTELIESVADLIVRSRAQQTFVPVPNRYIVGTPLRAPEMFFGREDELAWIAEHLREPGNSIVLFVGQRRIGKTSLLHQTAARAHGILPVFIDTQALIPTLYSDKDFFVQIGNAVCEQLKCRQSQGGGSSQNLQPVTGPVDLAALVSRVSATGSRLVLLIDEMENLDIKFRRGELSASPLLWMAGQIEGQARFSIITTGSAELPKNGAGWDKLAAKVRLRKISFLAPSEAERLVRTPVRGLVSFHQGTVECLLRFTGCHPYFTQDFCHRLITHINQTQHSDVDSDDTEVILEDMVRNAPNAIDHAWSQLDAPRQAAAAAMAGALKSSTEFAAPAEALKFVPPEIRRECFQRDVDFQLTLNAMLSEEYLERQGDGYRFRCDLWRRWIGEYHPLEM